MLILVDMDGVLANFDKHWIELYEKKYEVKLPEPTTFKLEECWAGQGVTVDTVREIMATPGFFRDLEPMPGAIDAMKMMVECDNDVFICTTPQADTKSIMEKMEWVDYHFDGDYKWLDRVITTRDKTLVGGDILIDDKPVIKGLYEEPDWLHVLYDRGYNRSPGNASTAVGRITWKDWPKIYELHKSHNVG